MPRNDETGEKTEEATFSATGKENEGAKQEPSPAQDADSSETLGPADGAHAAKSPWPTAEDFEAGANETARTDLGEEEQDAAKKAAEKKAEERMSRAYTADGKIRPGFAADSLRPKRQKRAKARPKTETEVGADPTEASDDAANNADKKQSA